MLGVALIPTLGCKACQAQEVHLKTRWFSFPLLKPAPCQMIQEQKYLGCSV